MLLFSFYWLCRNSPFTKGRLCGYVYKCTPAKNDLLAKSCYVYLFWLF